MNIDFATERLRKKLTARRELVKAFGEDGAKKIQARLSTLEAADTLDDMRYFPGRCHELKGDYRGSLAVDVEHPRRLIFKPAEPVPTKEDGGLDWSRVDRIVIIDVVDYH